MAIIFLNRKILAIGFVFVLAGFVFLIAVPSAMASGCEDSQEKISFSAFLNPLASLAEKVARGFGYEVALATAPDPDFCGTTPYQAMDNVACSFGLPQAAINWPAAPGTILVNGWDVNTLCFYELTVGGVTYSPISGTSYTVMDGLLSNAPYSWSVDARYVSSQNVGNCSVGGGWNYFSGLSGTDLPGGSFITPNCSPFVLSVWKTGTCSGVVNSSPPGISCGIDCDENYANGISVSLMPDPDNGCMFGGWSGDCDSNGTVTMNSNKSCTAAFNPIPPVTYNLFVSKDGDGSGTVIGPVGTQDGIYCGTVNCSETYGSGTLVGLNASADNGSTFVGWSGDCDSSGSVTMNSNKSCTARFNLNPGGCVASCPDWNTVPCSQVCGSGTQTRICTKTNCDTYPETQSCNNEACNFNGVPTAVASISTDGVNYYGSITVTQGVPTTVYLSAKGSNDPDLWNNPVYGVSAGGSCRWNSDLNPGGPTFETTITSPANQLDCNIGPLPVNSTGVPQSPGTITFNNPGQYLYYVLEVRDKQGASSNWAWVYVDVLPSGIPAPAPEESCPIGQLFQNSQNPNDELGGGALSPAAVGSLSDGTLLFVVRGGGNSIYWKIRKYDGTYDPPTIGVWYLMDGLTPSQPKLVKVGSDLWLYVIANDNYHVYKRTFSSATHSWQGGWGDPIAGVTAADFPPAGPSTIKLPFWPSTKYKVEATPTSIWLQTCQAAPPVGEAKYKCQNNSCVQDDINGTYTVPNCNGACGGGGNLTPGPSCSLTSNPAAIVFPGSSALSWSCEDATSCSINQGIGTVNNVSGNIQVSPPQTTAYTLSCSGDGGSGNWPAIVSVGFLPWLREILPRF